MGKVLTIIVIGFPGIGAAQEWIELPGFPEMIFVSNVANQLEDGTNTAELLYSFREPRESPGMDGRIYLVQSITIFVHIDCQQTIGNEIARKFYAFPMAKGLVEYAQESDRLMNSQVVRAACYALGI